MLENNRSILKLDNIHVEKDVVNLRSASLLGEIVKNDMLGNLFNGFYRRCDARIALFVNANKALPYMLDSNVSASKTV